MCDNGFCLIKSFGSYDLCKIGDKPQLALRVHQFQPVQVYRAGHMTTPCSNDSGTGVLFGRTGIPDQDGIVANTCHDISFFSDETGVYLQPCCGRFGLRHFIRQR